MERLNCSNNDQTLRSSVSLNIPLVSKALKFDPTKTYYAKIGLYVYKIEHDSSLKENQIRMNAYQRGETSIEDTKSIKIIDESELKKCLDKNVRVFAVDISMVSDNKTIVTLEKDKTEKQIRDYLIDKKIVLSDEQSIFYRGVRGTPFRLNISTNSVNPVIVDNSIDIVLATSSLNIVLAENKSIFNMNLNLEDMGIGGLNREFNTMFRRAFSSRMLKPETVKKLGIKHVRGVLLDGPPGCGKTLIIRKICEAISSVPPKIVNGPDILSRYVGQSEENIRELFADAEAEYKQKGENSRLHIIGFDEIDSICKARGSTQGGTGVNDTIVNQLLTKFDGVDQLNNILVFGMTNRPDMLDDALLRPGRFEIHLHISLPDLDGRHQIFMVHTKKLRDSNRIMPDVKIDDLAKRTKNYTGAEIEGLVNSARSCAIQRATVFEPNGSATVDEEKINVRMSDFDFALKEIQPKFGFDTTIAEQMSRYGVINYSDTFDKFYQKMKSDVKSFNNSINKQMVCYISGTSKSGRSTLAMDMAIKTNYPFIKYISGKSVIGMIESQKAKYIKTCFDDADRSPQSVIILDDIENIIDWVHSDITGVPRFSQSVCATFKSIINYYHSNKRLVIFTFDEESLKHISKIRLLPSADREYDIPSAPESKINPEIQKLLAESNKTEYKHVEVDTTVPIGKYIFEYNNGEAYTAPLKKKETSTSDDLFELNNEILSSLKLEVDALADNYCDDDTRRIDDESSDNDDHTERKSDKSVVPSISTKSGSSNNSNNVAKITTSSTLPSEKQLVDNLTKTLSYTTSS